MITYNHEPFIAQAIESALMQETDFDYEIVIGEDCSTDGTREIVRQYAQKYPDTIRAMLQEKNTGGKQNFSKSLAACQGEYIALLEGDDYWTYPQKLQEQVKLLDVHSEYSMCFHNVYQESSNGRRVDRMERFLRSRGQICKQRITLDDIVRGYAVPTNSAVVRREVFPLPAIVSRSAGSDRFIWTVAAQRGDLAYIDELWAVYRVHDGGVFSGISAIDKLQHLLKNDHLMNEMLEYKYDVQLRRRMADRHYQMAKLLLKDRQKRSAARHAWRCFRNHPLHPGLARLLVKMLLR
ncbi:MAG: glycosyltransferase [Candidatus Nealsonbacteria bacterium]|nr:glycosyltransferase [Candidatus Nealsonbacteria bacterium]